MEIDLLGAAGPETWVCQSKWVESKKIGINDLKKLNQQAENAFMQADFICIQSAYFSIICTIFSFFHIQNHLPYIFLNPY
jgi:hypothetical protein